MGDGEAKGATEFAAEYPELAARMVKALSQADEAETPWPVSTSFVASHDIVAIIGNLPGSDEDSDETSSEVIDSVIDAAVSRGLIHSAREVGEDGLAIAVARCCRGGSIGCYIAVDDHEIRPEDAEVALAGCVLVSLPCDRVEQLADALDDVDVPYAALGQVGGDHIIVAGVPSNETYVDLALSEL